MFLQANTIIYMLSLPVLQAGETMGKQLASRWCVVDIFGHHPYPPRREANPRATTESPRAILFGKTARRRRDTDYAGLFMRWLGGRSGFYIDRLSRRALSHLDLLEDCLSSVEDRSSNLRKNWISAGWQSGHLKFYRGDFRDD